MDEYINQIRRLLSGQCVVALDTNILIKLEEGTPEWFNDFVKMREAGVKFAIPDICIGERLNRYEQADANYFEDMKLTWRRMVSQLDKIIWKDFPCLPLRGELYDLVGVKERNNDVPYIRERPLTLDRAKKLYHFFHAYSSSPYNRKGQRDPCIGELKKVRHEWKKWILDWRKKSSGKSVQEMCDDYMSELESTFTSTVEILSLFELPVRFAAECAHDNRYFPTDDDDCYHQKKDPSNDGLDYAILFLTMASINICSFDKLFKRVGSMKNFHRSCCCHKPEAIYGEWCRGELPHVVLSHVADELC